MPRGINGPPCNFRTFALCVSARIHHFRAWNREYCGHDLRHPELGEEIYAFHQDGNLPRIIAPSTKRVQGPITFWPQAWSGRTRNLVYPASTEAVHNTQPPRLWSLGLSPRRACRLPHLFAAKLAPRLRGGKTLWVGFCG